MCVCVFTCIPLEGSAHTGWAAGVVYTAVSIGRLRLRGRKASYYIRHELGEPQTAWLNSVPISPLGLLAWSEPAPDAGGETVL